jgi:hypothetical protein
MTCLEEIRLRREDFLSGWSGSPLDGFFMIRAERRFPSGMTSKDWTDSVRERRTKMEGQTKEAMLERE